MSDFKLDPRDCVYTPPWAVQLLIDWLCAPGRKRIPKTRVVDPFMGDGQALMTAADALIRHGHPVGKIAGVELHEGAYTVAQHYIAMFTAQHEIAAVIAHGDAREETGGVMNYVDVCRNENGAGWLLVTNPPFRSFGGNVQGPLKLCAEWAEVSCVLMPFRALGTQKRARWWSQGQGLYAVLMLDERPTFIRGMGWEDPNRPKDKHWGSDNQEYCWCVFKRGYGGYGAARYPQLHWLIRDPSKEV